MSKKPGLKTYERNIFRIEQLSAGLRPLWWSGVGGAKREVAQRIREFLRKYDGPDGRLGEALAIMAWRGHKQTSADENMPTHRTLCRRVLRISERRCFTLVLALNALDRSDVIIDHTRAVLTELGGIRCASRAGPKEVKKAKKKVSKALRNS